MKAVEEAEPCRVGALVDGELVREVIEPVIAGGVVASAGGVDECLREIRLADAGGAEDDEVRGPIDPVAGRESGDDVPVNGLFRI